MNVTFLSLEVCCLLRVSGSIKNFPDIPKDYPRFSELKYPMPKDSLATWCNGWSLFDKRFILFHKCGSNIY